ncbi:unnamed protein product, partial [Scytosiphon promiscuus]
GYDAASERDRKAAISMLPNALLSNHTCDWCRKDITGLCFMRCEECKATQEFPDLEAVDLCATCFLAGMEPPGHKKTHSYRVMDRLDKPIFTEDWTAAEELSLVDQTRKMGLGAWEEISDSKLFYRHYTGAELNARYLDTYLSRHGSVLPPHYLKHRPDGTFEEVPVPLTHPERCPPDFRGVKLNSREIRGRTIAELGTNPRYRYVRVWVAEPTTRRMRERPRVAVDGKPVCVFRLAWRVAPALVHCRLAGPGDAAPSSANGVALGGGGVGANAAGGTGTQSSSRPATKLKKKRADKANKAKEEEREIREWTEKLPGADLSVYAPLRGDFDHEHDDSAEELLANMEFRPTDHASEKQLKLDVIAVYNHRLDEREKRKRFVIDHNLLDYKKTTLTGGGKKRPREDRDLVARLRPFARFSSPKQHDELIDNLISAKKIRTRIEQLQVYRQNGITTLADGIEFDKARQRRQEEVSEEE